MLAQSAQREWCYSESVQEFRGSFANIAASFAAIAGKMAVRPWLVFHGKEHLSDNIQKSKPEKGLFPLIFYIWA